MAEESEIRLAAGVQDKPGALAVDLRFNPERVIGADGLHAQTANQDLNKPSHRRARRASKAVVPLIDLITDAIVMCFYASRIARRGLPANGPETRL